MMRSLFFVLFVLAGCIGGNPVQAKIKLNTIFGDNMVLQQQSDVLFRGTGSANKKIEAIPSWNKRKVYAQSDSDGKWELKIAAPEAGGPYSITFSDGEVLTLNNILIGEVWFCAGQSNMDMPVKGYRGQPVAGSQPYIVSADAGRPLRLFTVKNIWSTTPCEDGVEGEWLESDSRNVANFSATAYFFGELLQRSIDVPVGLIQCAWGASKIEAWMDRSTLNQFPLVELPDVNQTEFGWPAGTPTLLWNAMVNPWKGMPVKGVLWYQGEANTPDPIIYKKLFPEMINQWRSFFNSPELPFYYVQIAPWQSGGSDQTDWALFRECQLELSKQLTNVGMVTSGDAGSEKFIHPPHKIKIGERLAYWALAKTYGREGFMFSGPIYKQHRVNKDNRLEVEFEFGEDGLVPENEPVLGFEMAGEDGVFYRANAEIINGSSFVQVWSDEVAHPREVRYCFRNYIEGNLRNNADIPASPFRFFIK